MFYSVHKEFIYKITGFLPKILKKAKIITFLRFVTLDSIFFTCFDVQLEL